MRFAISVSSVALAVLLILLLSGFLSGMNAQITAYLNHAPGSLVVAQAGVKNVLARAPCFGEALTALSKPEGPRKLCRC